MRYPNNPLTIRKDRFSIRKYSQELFRVILYPLVLSRTIMRRLPTRKDSQGLFGISQKDSVTFLQHNFDCPSLHVLRLRFKKSGPWVCWQCGAYHALTPA